MKEDLETREQWEFSGEEDELRELRGVLSENRSRRSSSGAAVSYLVLGGLIGLVGYGGYYGLNILLPPIPTDADLAAVDSPPVDVAANDARPNEVAPADAAPADVASPAEAAGPSKIASNSAAPAGLTGPSEATPPAGLAVDAPAPVDVAVNSSTPGDVSAPGRTDAPVQIAAYAAAPSGLAETGGVETPQSIGANNSAPMDVAVNDAAPADVALSGALANHQSSPDVAMDPASPINMGDSGSASSPRGSNAMEVASIDSAEAPRTPGLISNAHRNDASSPRFEPSVVAAGALSGVGAGPNPLAASPSQSADSATLEVKNPREVDGLAEIASLGPQSFDGRIPDRSPISAASVHQSAAAPNLPSISSTPSQESSGDEPAGDVNVRAVALIQPLAAEPRAPEGVVVAALSQGPFQFAPAAPTHAPRIESQPLSAEPVAARTDAVSAPGVTQTDIFIAEPTPAPDARRLALAAPSMPLVSASGGMGGGSADLGFAPRSSALSLLDEPRSPEVIVVASLGDGLNSYWADLPAPISAAGVEALAALQDSPAAFEAVQSVTLASIDETAPAFATSSVTAHASRADGAGRASLVAPLIEFEEGQKKAAELVGRSFAAGRAPQSPDSATAPRAAVQVASISPLAPVMTTAPSEESLIAAGAAMDMAAIGGAPTDLSTTPAEAASPSFSFANVQTSSGHEPAVVIASIQIGSELISELDPENAAQLAALVDIEPRFELPSTPNVTVDPAAAFSEPLDTLSSVPRSNAPIQASPARIASLGAQSTAILTPAAAPLETDVDYLNDSGRNAARIAVMAAVRAPVEEKPGRAPVYDDDWVDERPAWVRNGVAPPVNPKGLPVLAIVIDEVGAYGARAEEVTSLPSTVTVSVIPSTEDAAKIVRRMRFSRREVLAHIPLEANGEADLGPRPILTGMSDVQVQETTQWHLTQFNDYMGVNTHRGGNATRDRRVMEAMMPLLEARGLLFLDSRNASDSVAEDVAREAGMLTASNNFFIDEKQHTSGIKKQLNAAAEYAIENGAAIAIGNPHKVTIQAVKAWMKKYNGRRVLVAPLTHVAQIANGATGADVIVAGLPPKRPPPRPKLDEVAKDLSEGASESIKSTLSGIAADISQRLFNN